MYYPPLQMSEPTNTQKLVTLHVSDEMFEATEVCRKKRGKARAQWMREAIAEKLARDGLILSPEAVQAPDRAGKAGRKRKVVTMPPADKKLEANAPADAKVAEDHGPPPESASSSRKKVKYPRGKKS